MDDVETNNKVHLRTGFSKTSIQYSNRNRIGMKHFLEALQEDSTYDNAFVLKVLDRVIPRRTQH
jgi:hypothetical protein